MLIAVVHGYLLRGTGSNLYVSNLCRTFCRLGQRVLLFSQEEEPWAFDFISSSEEFNEDNNSANVTMEQKKTPYPGSCVHYRPHLGGMLPVYVYDRYKGFEVKEFPALSEQEIEGYLERNRLALETAFKQNPPDLVISQHTIMQPVYTARALAGLEGKARHLVTVHGSALNFSVRKSGLLRRYALEGITGADGLVFVSSHSRADFTAYFSDVPGLADKCRVIFAGVNTDLFQPLERPDQKREKVAELQALLKKAAAEKGGGKGARDKEEFYKELQAKSSTEEIRDLIAGCRDHFDAWAPDEDAAGNLGGVDWDREKIVLYYGKYLWTKGIHLLIAALPLVLQKYPHTRLILVGFGAAREYLEALVGVLDQGRLDLALKMIERPKYFSTGEMGPNGEESAYSAGLKRLLSDQRSASPYREACQGKIRKKVIFTGIMDHEKLKKLIPCAEVAVAPSIFPEAFGLVGVEALACGVLPVQTYHSGFADVVDVYEENFRDVFTAAGIKNLHLDENLVPGLADNIKALLGYLEEITAEERARLAQRAHLVAEKQFSWDRIAESYLEL